MKLFKGLAGLVAGALRRAGRSLLRLPVFPAPLRVREKDLVHYLGEMERHFRNGRM